MPKLGLQPYEADQLGQGVEAPEPANRLSSQFPIITAC